MHDQKKSSAKDTLNKHAMKCEKKDQNNTK